jgi:putative membrane protein (TIGR04086 family)
VSNSKSSKAQKNNASERIRTILFGVLPAIIFTIAAVLLFALIIKVFSVSDNAIMPVNQIIKILGVALCGFIIGRKCKEKPALMGALAGVIYVVVGFLLFSLVNGSFSPSLSLLSDAVMGAVIGLICAIIAAKLIK